MLDDRARLAFTNGHCHSLALALQARVGGDLVALARTQEPLDHVLVRSVRGDLIDVGGARSAASVISGGGTLFDVRRNDLERLTDAGWAAPDPAAASPWVEPLLERVERGMPHVQCGIFTHDFEMGTEVKLHLEWTSADGGLRLVLYGRLKAGAPREWTRCLSVLVPKNSANERLIDFSPERFRELAQNLEGSMPAVQEQILRNLQDPREQGTPAEPPD